jgi:iron complex outermembrane receptor protein
LRLGVQATASVTLDDVFAAASVTAVDARLVDSGGAVPFAPPLVARIDVGTRQAVAVVSGVEVAVFANVAASAIGARPLPFGDSADAFAVVSGNVGVGIGAVSVSVDADNVTDARYADGAFTYASRFAPSESIVPAEHITAAPPRLVQLTLSVGL